jgi:hypothetical protein
LIFRLLSSVLLLGAIGGGGVFALAQQQPTVSAGLGEVAVSPAAASSFDAKVNAVQAAVDDAKRTGKATPVEVTFSEAELTSKVAEVTPSAGGFATTATQIHLSGGDLVATSTVNVAGLSVNVGVVATSVVENGEAKLVVKEIQTGGLPLPDAIRQQLAVQIGTALDLESLGLPIAVSSLRIVDGKIVVTGTAKP